MSKMNLPQDIIIRPHISEKTQMNGKYTFIVHPRAKKPQIKAAIEELYNVKVLEVNTMNYLGKKKRMRYHLGKRPDFKKAIVTIDQNPYQETYLDKNGKEVVVNKKYKTVIDEFGAAQ